jgi:hypothetical protein
LSVATAPVSNECSTRTRQLGVAARRFRFHRFQASQNRPPRTARTYAFAIQSASAALLQCDERMRRRLSSGHMHLGESDGALRSARWTGTIAMSPLRSPGLRTRERESSRADPVS